MNKQINKNQNQTYKYREWTGGCQRGGGWKNGQNGWRGVGNRTFQLWNEKIIGTQVIV